MAAKVGERVGAVLYASDGKAVLLGYGVRLEDEVPFGGVGPMAVALGETETTNPCLLLDSGEKVYGCECWWGSEEEMKELLSRFEVTEKTITEVRNEYRKKQTSESADLS